MKLKSSYQKIFQIEAAVTSVWILDSLKKLEKNPSDKKAIESLRNYADVIVGDAKFLRNKELEDIAKIIINLFEGDSLTPQKVTEIRTIIDKFKNAVI